ncbi:MAG: NYN domain-containing protein [Clostridiales bacterium]|nr:NYN domain-containing protein [Clostridiales bacterium]
MDNKLYNVAIYIDYENVYKTLLGQYKNLLRLGFFEKLHKWCKAKNLRIVKIIAYCNFDNKDLMESRHQTRLQEYGINTVHTSNRGKNYADQQITIDALNDMYINDNIDEFIIMSNDKDMSPLLNTIKLNKRKVTLLTVGTNYDFALCNVPDEHITLNDILNIKMDEELYIQRVEREVKENIENYAKSNLEASIMKNTEFKHIEIKYYVENQDTYSSIMEYELYNMLKNLYDKKLISIYRYTYRNSTFYAIMPTNYLDKAIDNNIIKTEDIEENYNFDSLIKRSYEYYANL